MICLTEKVSFPSEKYKTSIKPLWICNIKKVELQIQTDVHLNPCCDNGRYERPKASESTQSAQNV